MANFTVKLENVKGIKSLEFYVPKQKGVYLITGSNGCGKTTLLVALDRIKSQNAFANYLYPGSNGTIDLYADAKFTFMADGDSVTYQRTGVRWVPCPKTSNVLQQFPFSQTKFITASTSGSRFFGHSHKDLKGKRISYNSVDDEIINTMNMIFDTRKYNDLKTVIVKNKRGKQKCFHRNNNLYVIKPSTGDPYSEINFSLGERLLLNTLEYIKDVPSKALLLIDEIELALHPIAQSKFYDYLQEKAKEKEITVLISTHSSSLILHADKKYYLENNEGIVSVIENCYPAYILKSISESEERIPDFLFLVEDDMAKRYLQNIINKYQQTEDKHIIFRIIPSGTWDSVVKLMCHFKTIAPFNENKVQAFLDADVSEAKEKYQRNTTLSEGDKKKLDLLTLNSNNISFLHITPELGVWDWLKSNSNVFEKYIEDKGYHADLHSIVGTVNTEESGKSPGNSQKHAKGCFQNLKSKIINQVDPSLTEADVYSWLFDCYTTEYMNDAAFFNKIKHTIKTIVNR